MEPGTSPDGEWPGSCASGKAPIYILNVLNKFASPLAPVPPSPIGPCQGICDPQDRFLARPEMGVGQTGWRLSKALRLSNLGFFSSILADFPAFEYYHLRSAHEPILWIPDAVAWAWGRGGNWRRQVERLGLISSLTRVKLP